MGTKSSQRGSPTRRGQPDLEETSPSDSALDFHGAAVEVDEMLDDRQAQSASGPSLRTRAVDLIEALEDLVPFGARNSRSEVLDGEPRPTRLPEGPESHGRALGRLRGGVRPSLILLDLMMPIMNGWQFRYEQRQDSDLAKIPVVVVSAKSDSKQHAEWLEADGYISKPIDPSLLLGMVGRYCDGAAQTHH